MNPTFLKFVYSTVLPWAVKQGLVNPGAPSPQGMTLKEIWDRFQQVNPIPPANVDIPPSELFPGGGVYVPGAQFNYIQQEEVDHLLALNNDGSLITNISSPAQTTLTVNGVQETAFATTVDLDNGTQMTTTTSSTTNSDGKVQPVSVSTYSDESAVVSTTDSNGAVHVLKFDSNGNIEGSASTSNNAQNSSAGITSDYITINLDTTTAVMFVSSFSESIVRNSASVIKMKPDGTEQVTSLATMTSGGLTEVTRIDADNTATNFVTDQSGKEVSSISFNWSDGTMTMTDNTTGTTQTFPAATDPEVAVADSIENQATPLTASVASDLAVKTINSADNGGAALSGNDVVLLGSDDSTIYSGNGNNTFVWQPDSGNDTITINNSQSNGGQGHDTLQFQNLLSGSIEFSRNDNDLVCTVEQTGQTVTVSNWCLGSSHQVGQIQFADGTLSNASVNRKIS